MSDLLTQAGHPTPWKIQVIGTDAHVIDAEQDTVNSFDPDDLPFWHLIVVAVNEYAERRTAPSHAWFLPESCPDEVATFLSTKTIFRVAAAPGSNVADQIISKIEERFPNWRSFRDLLDCIDCTLHELRRTAAAPGGGMAVLGEIAAERRRQIEIEGWTLEHDDAHSEGEMAIAAACYATAPLMLQIEREWVPPDTPKNWPWHFSWWKPGFRRNNLIKAAALIVAEIERLDRASLRHASPCPSPAPGAVVRLLSKWSEEDGAVLWWKFPIEEPPYVGTPNDIGREVMISTKVMTLRGDDPVATVVVEPYQGSSGQRVNIGGWPGYHTHWTPIPMPKEPTHD